MGVTTDIPLTSLRYVDVLVVGSDNAGFSAAISAAGSGATHCMRRANRQVPIRMGWRQQLLQPRCISNCPQRPGDLLPLVNNVDADTARLIDLEPYTTQDFRKGMDRVTAGRSDPALSRVLIQDSNATIKWLWKNGIRSQLSFNRQAYKVDGRFKFWGGMALKRKTIAVISTSNSEVEVLFCVGEIARRTILWQLFRWQWIDFRSSLWTESGEGNCGGSGEAVSGAVRSIL